MDKNSELSTFDKALIAEVEARLRHDIRAGKQLCATCGFSTLEPGSYFKHGAPVDASYLRCTWLEENAIPSAVTFRVLDDRPITPYGSGAKCPCWKPGGVAARILALVESAAEPEL
jgi:hypothetical protein